MKRPGEPSRHRRASLLAVAACASATVLTPLPAAAHPAASAPRSTAAHPASAPLDTSARTGSAPAATHTERISLAPDGSQADGASYAGGLTPNGRYAVFLSDATNLVPGDTNGRFDVFVRDLRTGRTERVNVADDGTQANGDTTNPTISADGRFVAFESTAGNLVPGDVNGDDVFVRDRRTGHTERVTVGDPAQAQPAGTQMAVISANGRRVAFASARSDLVPGDDNRAQDIFVWDRKDKSTRRVNVTDDGTQASSPATTPTISDDGRRVGFVSRDYGLDTSPSPRADDGGGAPRTRKPRYYPMFVHDLQRHTTRAASLGSDNETLYGGGQGRISADGRHAVFASMSDNVAPGDSNGHIDVFVRDLRGRTTELVSLAHDGAQIDASSYAAALSPDRRWVYFTSGGDNVVPDDTNAAIDVFARDLRTGAVQRLNVDDGGGVIDGYWDGPYPDRHARASLFTSDAPGLVPDDTNGRPDVFLRR